MDLAEALNAETRLPWERFDRPDAAKLFFGRPIPDGPRTIASHCAVVWAGRPGEWHVDVLRYNPQAERGTTQALRIPGTLSWIKLLEFLELLVQKLGGVSPLYQPVQG